MTEVTSYLIAATTAAIVCAVVIGLRMRGTSARRTRTNWRGRPVAAVLADGVVLGSLSGLAVVLAADTVPPRVVGAVGLVLAVMFAAGLWDDLRGAELQRGFSGHLRALQGGGITGGIVKLIAGGAAGVAAGLLVAGGDLGAVAETALLVPLMANTVNLLDRAPGRALKVSLAVGLPLVVWGASIWSGAAIAMVAALIVCLPFDLRERGMLGDAGANPIGAVLGLGLALSLTEPARLVAIVLLVAVNLVSEKISFSSVIESNKMLAWLDRMGRA